jgi:hypothetical protein
MAEALAVIGLVSAIVQFVDFGSKVVSRLHDLREEVAAGPKVFQDVRTRLPLMLDLVRNVQNQFNGGTVAKASQEVMLPVIQSCLAQVKLLDELFDKAIPKLNDSSWHRGRKAITSVIRESEVEKIDSVLKTNCDLLVQSGTFNSLSQLERRESSSTQQMVNVIFPSQHSCSPPKYEYTQRSDSVISVPVAPVFMVPFQRDQKFLRRQTILDEIELKFRTQRQVALAGLGGVG